MSKLLISCFIVCLTEVAGDVIVQDQKLCGTQMRPKIERVQEADFNVYSHSGKVSYYADSNCVVTFIGEPYYQWEIKLLLLDIDGHKCREYTPCCNDYLKIFNAYTVDNARLLPSIPWRGLCGSGLPRVTTFTTSQNFVTIQFFSDILGESLKKGFILQMRQYPRRNSGNAYGVGYFGGWNDGTLSELQIDWSEQERIPGDYTPNNDDDYDKDPNGVSCYSCVTCNRDYFKTDSIGVEVKTGCYVCTKEWYQGSGQARRGCLSRSGFQDKLLGLRDVSTGTVSTTEFRACKKFSESFETTNYINLCVCDSDKCNGSVKFKPNWLLTTAVAVVLRHWLKHL